jgi:hypothetical protein
MIMTQQKIPAQTVQDNLFFSVPDTTLSALVAEVTKVRLRFPEILTKIKDDQDRFGLKNKQLRLEEKRWLEQKR